MSKNQGSISIATFGINPTFSNPKDNPPHPQKRSAKVILVLIGFLLILFGIYVQSNSITIGRKSVNADASFEYRWNVIERYYKFRGLPRRSERTKKPDKYEKISDFLDDNYIASF